MRAMATGDTLMAVAMLCLPATMAQLDQAELARANLARPLPSSHVVGGDPKAIFAAMNRHLRRQAHHTRPCEEFSLDELNQACHRVDRRPA